ncbi:MAG TPA: hypothetical protein VEU76_09970 [Candidatus Udaeobacter sp.]|nr:hypothetical protein [Candidatus Udaeobacter sp.]
MRRGFGLLGLVATAVLLVIVGAIAYNIGWSDGVGTHLPAATAPNGAPYYYYYGYGPHFFGGIGAIFGLFWFLLIVFGIFWLFRMAFFGRRMWGGGWYGRGMGSGPGHSFEERAQEWHRRQHGEQPPAGTTPPPPPPDTRSV